MFAELWRALPAALLFALPATAVGGLLLHRMRRRSVTAAMTTLALVPLVAALGGVVAVSGFMYTPSWPARSLWSWSSPWWSSRWPRCSGGASPARRCGSGRPGRRSGAPRPPAGSWSSWMSHDLRSPLAGIRGMVDAL